MSFSRAGLAAALLVAAACGGTNTGAGQRSIRGADAFFAYSSGRVAFVVFSAPWILAREGESITGRGSGTERIDRSWLAIDGGRVTLSAPLREPGEGRVTIDGRNYSLADGNVFAMRREAGVTVVVQSKGGELVDPDFGAALLPHEVFLGLDRPPPMSLRVVGPIDGGGWTHFGIEMTNRSDRPIRSYSAVAFSWDAQGKPLEQDFDAPQSWSVAWPPGKPLAEGVTRRDSIPRSREAEYAVVFVTEVEFEFGEPGIWRPAE